MGSVWGQVFRVTTFGESHGGAVGCVVDGCPPRIAVTLDDIQCQLNRRKPGQSAFTTPRAEADVAEILSGIYDGQTLGTPICIMVRNKDARTGDYGDIAQVFRPSHADFTTQAKYGIRMPGGGGRSSARETIGRVAAAALARVMLKSFFPDIDVVAWVQRVGDIAASCDPASVTLEAVEKSLIRCPDAQAESAMKALILDAKDQGDTVGGLISAQIRHVPAGWGEPVFDKLEADLAKGMMSLPATKSFEVGSGLSGTYLRGSNHNDAFIPGSAGKVTTVTNRSGGIQGGISNGMPIEFSVGFKPVSTLFKEQKTVNLEGDAVVFKPQGGRHDACVLPRAVSMVEAMAWLTLADHFLRHQALVPKIS